MSDSGKARAGRPEASVPGGGVRWRRILWPSLAAAAAVFAWLTLRGWLDAGADPRALARALAERPSWSTAYMLSQALRDPKRRDVLRDAGLAGALGSLLRARVAAGGEDEDAVRFRIYLCRALGEFRTPAALPPLVDAARRDPALPARRAAVEALALAAHHAGADAARREPGLVEALLAASQPAVSGGSDSLRSAAAFALGVVGGVRADARLLQLLGDPAPLVRYNAATGLSRRGDLRAAPVIAEMLDPEAPLGGGPAGEPPAARVRRRLTILENGIQAADRLLDRAPPEAAEPLAAALRRLARRGPRDAPPQARRAVARRAREVLLRREAGEAGPSGGVVTAR